MELGHERHMHHIGGHHNEKLLIIHALRTGFVETLGDQSPDDLSNVLDRNRLKLGQELLALF